MNTVSVESLDDKYLEGIDVTKEELSKKLDKPLGCSMSPNDILSVSALGPCIRHDIRYRLSKFSDRREADQILRKELKNRYKEDGWKDEIADEMADVYFYFVREFAGDEFVE